jgi:hypothetical protein
MIHQSLNVNSQDLTDLTVAMSIFQLLESDNDLKNKVTLHTLRKLNQM